MAYQIVKTQPERSSLSWSRTRISLLLVTVILFRFALGSAEIAVLIGLGLSMTAFLLGQIVSSRRKAVLRKGLMAEYTIGLQLFLVMVQLLMLSASALVLILTN